ncbi:hypothetical protein CDD82_5693 [Ophiocordyceps australis]|uniref:non-specific serine/threonine protein kinase n=1 Tax=Ophiocordyceps australis TaxID=1399860 RepID=A0A2C5YU11_9HYPO|nr:hypothetical protein CDD82_5693 [Ophiocordyceps australis]
MSLIPYLPREGREIVLRHHNAIVVRDPDSQQLEIRRTECPTCHQPLPGSSSSPERPYERQFDMSHEYVNPEYFRMLRTGSQHNVVSRAGAPSSPVKRFFQPALPGYSGEASSRSPASEARPRTPSSASTGGGLDKETETEAEGSRIRKTAFSDRYFETFFVEERLLGKGGKGVVLLVRHEIDGCQLGHFACKRVPVGDDHGWLEKVLVEVELLAKLSHPNLVSYRHVWLEYTQLTRFGPRVACAFILQQYCNGGDLHRYVVGSAPRDATKEELKARMRRRSKGQADTAKPARPQLSFEDIYSLFKDITSGVAYLHANNYIHRDLKPSNCLLHSEGGMVTCLISDFGEVQPEHMVRRSTGSTGTISYCAPEVLELDEATGCYGNFTTKSDMFSLGMILYFMCFGRLPYRAANAIQEELEDVDQLRAEIADWKGLHDQRRERPDLPPRLYKLLKKLLALDPGERPAATEVLSAMRSETNLDAVGRPDRPPSVAPGQRSSGRVQNLDSPMAPSTPIADGRKDRARHDLPGPWLRRDEAEAKTLRETLPSGLEASQRHGRTPTPPAQPADSPSHHHHDAHAQPSKLQTRLDAATPTPYSPPLLMAPPRTRAAELRYQLDMAMFRVCQLLGLSSHLGRLALFLLKLASLAQPCWPYVTRLQVALPLLLVAALDLAAPRAPSSSSSSSSSPPTPLLDRAAAAATRHVPAAASASAMATTLLLLVLHFVVLWLARRYNGLCVAPPQHDWGQW